MQHDFPQLLLVLLPLFQEHPEGGIDLFQVVGLCLQFLFPPAQGLVGPLPILDLLLQFEVGPGQLSRSLRHQFLEMVAISLQFLFGPLPGADIPQGHNIAERLTVATLIEGGAELDIQDLPLLGRTPGLEEIYLLAAQHPLDGGPGLGPAVLGHKIDLLSQ